ncbi:MAG: hypothetical protein COU51_04330 [Parcubacteria group bacterium CG10_big_fil_rev_8_21_14_0_10_36_14]|nr:MAG: hypothetical protein COU51_04330 [Parcubacteria group bacterium CG10_big_fil_rev_8_21_14_0_10_36_14]
MQTQPISAIRFLKQICAIKEAKEFWAKYNEQRIAFNAMPKTLKEIFLFSDFSTNFSIFYILNYPHIPNTQTIYQIISMDRRIEARTVEFFLRNFWEKHMLVLGQELKGPIISKSVDSIPGLKKYKGPLIVLAPPDSSSEFTLEEEKFDPMYVRNKMTQLRKAMERIRDNCPHINVTPLLDKPHMHSCFDCGRLMHTRELPKNNR